MKKIIVLIASISLGFLSMQSFAACEDPHLKVKSILECIEVEDIACANAGYDESFVKLHNGIDTNTDMSGGDFWEMAFQFSDFEFDYKTVKQLGANKAMLQYTEKVMLVNGKEFLQNELAIVDVNDSCQITKWNQYGSWAEQYAVEFAIIRLIIEMGLSGDMPIEGFEF